MFLSCAKAPPPPPSASAVPSSSAAMLFFILLLLCSLFSSSLYAEIGVKLVHVGLQVGIGKAVDDLAVLDNVVAVRHRGGEAEILLDQQDGEALRLQPRNGVADLLDD